MMKPILAAVLPLLTLPVLAQTPERWDIPFDARDWKLVAQTGRRAGL